MMLRLLDRRFNSDNDSLFTTNTFWQQNEKSMIPVIYVACIYLVHNMEISWGSGGTNPKEYFRFRCYRKVLIHQK
jgi:hypothetical protein